MDLELLVQAMSATCQLGHADTRRDGNIERFNRTARSQSNEFVDTFGRHAPQAKFLIAEDQQMGSI